jgi:hypothetical protein
MGKKLARAETSKAPQARGAKGRKKPLVIGIIAVAVAAVLGVGYLAVSASGPRRTPEGLVANGEQAPAFSLPRLGGNGSVAIADFKGKVVLVNFFSSQ